VNAGQNVSEEVTRKANDVEEIIETDNEQEIIETNVEEEIIETTVEKVIIENVNRNIETVMTSDCENDTNVAEESTNDDQDVPCENCLNMYAFHKDIRDNLCDLCLISIAKKEEISLLVSM
jgi:hypothetical protein